MAGNLVRPAGIGVGSALRRARMIRGISLEDAARDTKLRAEHLAALEDEDFEVLGGEVYVRASLRTYAQYLGLNPEKVLSAYARHAAEPEPPPPPGKMGRVEKAIAATRFRDNQRFLLVAAAVVLVALVAVGLVSRRGAPPPAALPTTTPTSAVRAAGGSIDVAIVASARVQVQAVVDGVPEEPVTLRPDEVVTFSASDELVLNASDGGLIGLTVDGLDRGTAGTAGEPWQETFTPGGTGG
ncbi:MAG TPA: helix-turn-helix transcriptional regulator [Actinomycetota bacterium]|jgi:cytoskeletal protein RodZ